MTTNSAERAADAREFDVVLFGATGFTGKLVAEYLVTKESRRSASGATSKPLRIALAGRSRDKLERVRAGLAAIDPAARELPIILGDSLDAASVGAMVARTRVVCTTVGPYARFGEPLVAACAERGVHYCDLTGETPFIRRIIDAHHERAATTGARIVPSCGFDSIPSDLGVLMLHEHLTEQGKSLAEAHYRLLRASGGASGGTIASMMNILEEAKDPSVRRILGDPYALDPRGAPRGSDGRDSTGPRRDADTGRWTAPFVMAAINTRIVRRSNALLGFAYGRHFRYDEAIDTGAGPLGLARAVAMSAAIGAGLGLVVLPPGRALAARFLPAPGEGPTREQRERGSFRVEIHARSTTGERLTGVVGAKLDPGYGATAIMLGEAAACLAQDSLSSPGGVLTTASCMGMPLLRRLRDAGMRFDVE
jgi:short subunit dehydrogenase-like uncharacterized protein